MPRKVLLLAAVLVAIPATAQAYVDPGLASMVIQGLFAAVAGFTAAYVLAPWRWIKSHFTKSAPQPSNKDEAGVGKGDQEISRSNPSP